MYWSDSISLKLRAALVFQGGGIRALFFPGHMVGLAKKGIDNTFACSGSSGGALIAIGIWAGLDPIELRDFLKSKSGMLGLARSMLSLWDVAQIGISYLVLSLLLSLNAILAVFSGVYRFLVGGSFRPYLEIYLGCTGRKFEDLINEMILLGLKKRGIHEDLISDFFGIEAKRFRPTFRQVEEIQKWIRLAASVRSVNDDAFATLLEVYPRLEGLKSRISFETDRWGQPRNNILDLLYGTKTAHDPYFPPVFISTCQVGDLAPVIFNNMEQRYLDVSVARIVRASAGHPLLFRPKRVKMSDAEMRFTDGGLIVNFPAASVGKQLRLIMDEKQSSSSDSDDYTTLAGSPYITVGLCADDHVDGLSYLGSMFGLITGGARDRLEAELSSYIPYMRVLKQVCFDQPHPLNFFRVRPKFIEKCVNSGIKFIDGSEISTTVHIIDQKQTIINSMELLLDITERHFLGSQSDYARCHFYVEAGKTPGLLLKKALLCRRCDDLEFEDRAESPTKPFSGLIGMSVSSRLPVLGKPDVARAVRAKNGKELLGLTADKLRHVPPDLNFLLCIPVFDWHTLDYQTGRTQVISTGDFDAFMRLYETGVSGAIIGMIVIDGKADRAESNIESLSEQLLRDGIVESMERVSLEISCALSKEITAALNPVPAV